MVKIDTKKTHSSILFGPWNKDKICVVNRKYYRLFLGFFCRMSYLIGSGGFCHFSIKSLPGISSEINSYLFEKLELIVDCVVSPDPGPTSQDKPDPNPASRDKLDPDPWFFQNRIRIQPPLSCKFSIQFMMIFNGKLLLFLTVVSHNF